MTMSYHELPPDVLEQPQELADWARKAIGVAASSKKPARRAKRNEAELRRKLWNQSQS